jgi:hypothetical protein
MSVTVVITNYLRPVNVGRLIDALCKQTVTPTLFVWDNSPTEVFQDDRVDWIIHSSKNACCAPRWWMASHAVTDFVIVHDDDLLPAHSKVLACTLEAAAKAAPFVIGAAGVILKNGSGYWESQHVGLRAKAIQVDTRVDVVKGSYFCCPVQRLAELGYMELDAEDDIAVSARLGNGLEHPHLVVAELRTSFELLEEGDHARKDRGNHRTAREAARRRFFNGPLHERSISKCVES